EAPRRPRPDARGDARPHVLTREPDPDPRRARGWRAARDCLTRASIDTCPEPRSRSAAGAALPSSGRETSEAPVRSPQAPAARLPDGTCTAPTLVSGRGQSARGDREVLNLKALSEEGPRVKSSLLVYLLSRSRTVGMLISFLALDAHRVGGSCLGFSIP